MLSLYENNEVQAEIRKLFSRSNKHKDCDSKEAGACDKPVNQSAMTLGLGIGIPAFVVLLVFGIILWRTYRKNKKEDMDTDPDFYETGEGTALPDLPSMQENPFDNRNSLPFPVKTRGGSPSISSSRTAQAEPYMGGFVLPYHHQTGSKASLDDYARQISGVNDYRLSGSGPYEKRGASALYSTKTRGNSVSPQKSSLRNEESNHSSSPTRAQKYNAPDYRYPADSRDNLMNSSANDLHHNKRDLSSDNKQIDSSSDSIKQPFKVSYEVESYNALTSNSNLISKSPSSVSLSKETFETSQSYDDVREQSKWNQSEQSDIEEVSAGSLSSDEEVKNVHEFPKDNIKSLTTEKEEDTPNEYSSSEMPVSSEEREKPSTGETAEYERSPSAIKEGHNNLDSEKEKKIGTPENAAKVPRMSAFNMLANDTDEEEEGQYDTQMSEEEVKRMMSVYKVYLDRSGSVASKPGPVEEQFEADFSQPLPEPTEQVRLNKDLKTEAAYDKRRTRASSIYTDTPIFTQDEQRIYQSQQTYAHQANMLQSPEMYHNQQFDQNNQQYYQHRPQEQVELPPLQRLPHPSDFRKSTIQTFTDYKPKSKNQHQVGTKVPFVPIENGTVWSSPVNSPNTQVSAQFGSQQSLSTQNTSKQNIPSATQISRSSIVMLNPVTEITKQRKFVPAGSLPSSGYSMQNIHAHQDQYQIPPSESSNDLIPGNRKSDVRRMMNSNF